MSDVEGPVPDARRWRAFSVCALVAALTLVDLAKVNVALPSIGHALGGTTSELALAISGYVLAFGVTLVPMGRLGDRGARRPLLVAGLVLFVAMSASCALATSLPILLASRLVQGVAAGMQMPQVLGIIQDLFRGVELGRAFGRFGAVVGISAAIAPAIGGVAVALGGPVDGWRWVFWMNVPIGIVAAIFAMIELPRDKPGSGPRQALDGGGTFLFGAAVFALILPFAASALGDSRWIWLAVSAVAFPVFVWWERRYERSGRLPLLPSALVSVNSFRMGASILGVYFAALPTMLLLITLFLQDGLGLSPLAAGLVAIGFAIANGISSWLAGPLVTRAGALMASIGLAIVFVGAAGILAIVAFAPPAAVPWAIAGVLGVAGIGGGMVSSSTQTLALIDVPRGMGGIAGSVTQLGQRIGTAIGTAVAIALFSAALGPLTGGSYVNAFAAGMSSVLFFYAVAFALTVIGIRRPRRIDRV